MKAMLTNAKMVPRASNQFGATHGRLTSPESMRWIQPAFRQRKLNTMYAQLEIASNWRLSENMSRIRLKIRSVHMPRVGAPYWFTLDRYFSAQPSTEAW